MAVFVIVAVSAGFLGLGAVAVAAVQLRRQVGQLSSVAGSGAARLKPVTDELRRELAVAEAETAAITERIEAARRERRGRRSSQGRRAT